MDEKLKLDNQLCYRLYNISREMTKAYQPFLEKFNLTYPQYIIMLAMFELRSVDFKELVVKVNLAPGTLTPILKRLEETGYILRTKNQQDSRRIEIKLSELGIELEQKIIEVPIAMSDKLNLSSEQFGTLINQLDALNHCLIQIKHST